MPSLLKTPSLKPWIHTVLLSAIFPVVYFMLRALPNMECGFLHYIEVINEDGEIELCATNHAGFIDLSVLRYPIEVQFPDEAELHCGQKANVTLHLKTSGGMPIAEHELAITHTQKMHLMLIDLSLENYNHLHPKSTGFDGLYEFEFTPERSGTYRAFTEIVPRRSRRQAIAFSELEVAGPAAAAPKFQYSTECIVDNFHFKLSRVPDVLKPRRDYPLNLNVTNSTNGQPARLELVMGAKGHMVAFDAHVQGFAHMHPVNRQNAPDRTEIPHGPNDDSTLTFYFNAPQSGWYRIFAQVQINGQPVYGRFDLEVMN